MMYYNILVVIFICFPHSIHGFINDPLDSTTLKTTSTTPSHVTNGGPSNPEAISAEVQRQLQTLQDSVDELKQDNAALDLKVTSLENDVTTLIQLQERVRTLEQDNINVNNKLAQIQSANGRSQNISNKVTSLESSTSGMKTDIASLKLQLGSASSSFNSQIQGLQTSLYGVKQSVSKLMSELSTTGSSGRDVTDTSPSFTPSTVPSSSNVPTTDHDCLDIYVRNSKPGVYMVHPPLSDKPFQVFCENGWTYIQRRIDGSLKFSSPYRDWDDFLGGFGNISGEFWLGNELIYQIVSQGSYTLRVEADGYSGKRYWAQYATFTIENEADDFRLYVSGYTGNYRDTMVTANGNAFSTYDIPNGISFYRDCGGIFAGGWWLNNTVPNCGYDLNALYARRGQSCMNFAGRCVKASSMKIRPR